MLYTYARGLIRLFDRFDEGSSELMGTHANPNRLPAVLVFLPGIYEINLMRKTLEQNWNAM